MKKVFGYILLTLTVAAFLFAPFLASAQDATIPDNGAAIDFFNFLFNFIPEKFKATAITVLTGLFLFEQFIASTQKIAANSTFQLVAKWIKVVYQSVLPKK